jgi:hypothetical protein
MQTLCANPVGNLAWKRGAHLRDEDIVTLIEEMCCGGDSAR